MKIFILIKKIVLLCIIISLSSYVIKAQTSVVNYVFTSDSTNKSFTPITIDGATILGASLTPELFDNKVLDGDTAYSLPGWDAGELITPIPLGFDFGYDNIIVKAISINTLGKIYFHKEIGEVELQGQYDYIIYPARTMNKVKNIVGDEAKKTVIAYKATENMGVKTMNILVKNLLVNAFEEDSWSGASTNDTISYQVEISSDNSIRFTYFDFKPSVREGEADIDYYNPTFNVGLKGVDKFLYLDGNWNKPVVSSYGNLELSDSKFPAENLTYTFTTPPECVTPAVSNLDVSITSFGDKASFTIHEETIISDYLLLAVCAKNITTPVLTDGTAFVEYDDYFLDIDKAVKIIKHQYPGEYGTEKVNILNLKGASDYKLLVYAMNTKCMNAPKYAIAQEIDFSTVCIEPTMEFVSAELDSIELNIGTANADDSVVVFIKEYGQDSLEVYRGKALNKVAIKNLTPLTNYTLLAKSYIVKGGEYVYSANFTTLDATTLGKAPFVYNFHELQSAGGGLPFGFIGARNGYGGPTCSFTTGNPEGHYEYQKQTHIAIKASSNAPAEVLYLELPAFYIDEVIANYIMGLDLVITKGYDGIPYELPDGAILDIQMVEYDKTDFATIMSITNTNFTATDNYQHIEEELLKSSIAKYVGKKVRLRLLIDIANPAGQYGGFEDFSVYVSSIGMTKKEITPPKVSISSYSFVSKVITAAQPMQLADATILGADILSNEFNQKVLVGAGGVSFNGFGSEKFTPIPLNFEFPYANILANSFLVRTNGDIYLMNDTGDEVELKMVTNILHGALSTEVFAIRDNAAKNTVIAYKEHGEPGSEVLSILFKNIISNIENGSGANATKVYDTISYQIDLSADGSITYTYFDMKLYAPDKTRVQTAFIIGLNAIPERRKLDNTNSTWTDPDFGAGNMFFSEDKTPTYGLTYKFSLPEKCETPEKSNFNIELTAYIDYAEAKMDTVTPHTGDEILIALTKANVSTPVLEKNKIYGAHKTFLDEAEEVMVIINPYVMIGNDPTIRGLTDLDTCAAYKLLIYSYNSKCLDGPIYAEAQEIVFSTLPVIPIIKVTEDNDSNFATVNLVAHSEEKDSVVLYIKPYASEEQTKMIYNGKSVENFKIEDLEKFTSYHLTAYSYDAYGIAIPYEEYITTLGTIPFDYDFDKLGFNLGSLPAGFASTGSDDGSTAWNLVKADKESEQEILRKAHFKATTSGYNGIPVSLTFPDVYMKEQGAYKLVLDIAMLYNNFVPHDSLNYTNLQIEISEAGLNDYEIFSTGVPALSLEDSSYQNLDIYFDETQLAQYANKKISIRLVFEADLSAGVEPIEVYLSDVKLVEYTKCEEIVGLNTTEITYRAAKLNWTAGASNVELRYKKENDAEYIYKDIVGSSFLLENLDGNTIYHWSLRAKCTETFMSEWAEDLPFTTQEIPECPTPLNLAANSITDNSAVLAWEGSQTKFNIMIFNSTGVCTDTIKEVAAKTYQLENLTPETSYGFKVQGIYDAYLCSEYSTLFEFTVLAEPTAPTNLTVENVTELSAKLTWNGDYESVNIVLENVTLSTIDTIAKGWNYSFYQFDDLTSNTTYKARVQGIEEDGTLSDYSENVDFVTLEGEVEECEVPTALSATDITVNSAKLLWEGNQAKFNVILLDGAGVPTDTIVNLTEKTYTWTNLVPNTKYGFKVQGICEGDILSEYSDIEYFTTLKSVSNENALFGEIEVYYALGNINILNKAQLEITKVEIIDINGRKLIEERSNTNGDIVIPCTADNQILLIRVCSNGSNKVFKVLAN